MLSRRRSFSANLKWPSARRSVRAGGVSLLLRCTTALLPAVIGITVGIVGGLVVTPFMASVLFGVSSLDLTTWLGACVIVLIACVAVGFSARASGGSY